jgi:1-acyl-sn-glycerol-3-phosphate acyltransferase
MLDAVALNYIFFPKKIHYMAKGNIFRGLFVKEIFLRTMGAHKIRDCDNGDDPIEFAVERLSKGDIYGITPEGSISPSGEVLPFRTGVVRIALKSNAPILPVFIRKRRSAFDYMHIMVGEPVSIGDVCPDGAPGDGSPENGAMREAAEGLRQVVVGLGDRLAVLDPE